MKASNRWYGRTTSGSPTYGKTNRSVWGISQNLTRQLVHYEKICKLEVESLTRNGQGVLTREQFIKAYYTRSEQDEEEILGLVNGPQNLIVVVAPRGSGKTTVLSKLQMEDFPSTVGSIRIDFEKEFIRWRNSALAKPTTRDYERMKESLANTIRRRIHKKYYSSDDARRVWNRKGAILNEDLSNPKLAVARRLVADDGVDFEDLGIGLDPELLAKVENDVELQTTSRDTLSLVSDLSYQPTRQALRTHVVPAMDFLHFIWGLKAYGILKKFVIIFDNVDRVSRQFQAHYVSLARHMQAGSNPLAQCIITIRPENVSRMDEAVGWTDHQNLMLYEMHHRELRSIPIDAVVDRGDEGFTTLRDVITKREMAMNCSDELSRLSRNVYAVYANHFLEDIFNQNCRLVLDVHPRFMNFIVSSLPRLLDGLLKHPGPDERLPPDLESQVLSAFFSWLDKHGDSVGLALYNVVSDVKAWRTDNHHACSARHLILARLLAAEQAAQRQNVRLRFVTTDDIQRDLADLGFDWIDETRPALHSLHWTTGFDGNLIYIQPSNVGTIESIDDIDEKARVWLTPRGREFIRSTAHKFHYILAGLEQDLPQTQREFAGMGDKVFAFCIDAVKQHLDGLERIRRALEPRHGRKWFDVFQSRFCVDPGIKKPEGPKLHMQLVLKNQEFFMKTLGLSNEAGQFKNLYDTYVRQAEEIVGRRIETTSEEALDASHGKASA